MLGILIFLIIALFLVLLFLNIYFRVKVLKYYKILVQNKVEFDAIHLFNRKKMEAEVYPKYPDLQEEITLFANYIKYSVRMGTLLVALITLLGAVLMYYRQD